jgi:hypothetical protein
MLPKRIQFPADRHRARLIPFHAAMALSPVAVSAAPSDFIALRSWIAMWLSGNIRIGIGS